MLIASFFICLKMMDSEESLGLAAVVLLAGDPNTGASENCQPQCCITQYPSAV